MTTPLQFSAHDERLADQILMALFQQDAHEVGAHVDTLLAGQDRNACQDRAARLLEHLTGESFVAADMATVETDSRLADFASVAAAIGRRIRGLPRPMSPTPPPPAQARAAPPAAEEAAPSDAQAAFDNGWSDRDDAFAQEVAAQYEIERGRAPARWQRHRAQQEMLAGLARQETHLDRLMADGQGGAAAALPLVPGADEDALALRQMRDEMLHNQVVSTAEEARPAALPGGSQQLPRSLFCPRSGALFSQPVLCRDGLVYESNQTSSRERVVACHTLRSVRLAWQDNVGRGPEALAQALTEALRCPIVLEPFVDPVTAADGHSYEAAGIRQHFEVAGRQARSPLTNQLLPNRNLMRNLTLRALMAELQQMMTGEPNTVPYLQVALVSIPDVERHNLAGTHFGSTANAERGLRDLAQLETWRMGGIFSVVNDSRFRRLAHRLEQRAREDLMATVGTLVPEVGDQSPIVATFILADVRRLLGDSQESLPLFLDLAERLPAEFASPVLGRVALLLLSVSVDDRGTELAKHYLGCHGPMVGFNSPDLLDSHWLAAFAEVCRRSGETLLADRTMQILTTRGLSVVEARQTRDRIRSDMQALGRR